MDSFEFRFWGLSLGCEPLGLEKRGSMALRGIYRV